MGKIEESINRYYNPIMNDMNASARIIVEGKEEEKTYITRIIDWKDREISFHAPLVLGEYVRLITGKSYSFVIVTKTCIYSTSVKVGKLTKNKQGHFYYKALIDSGLKRNQQRKYFRLEWINTFKYKTEESDDWSQGTTLDVSAGGLLMASKNNIERNASIHINITLFETDFVLYGVVLDSLGKNQTDMYISRVQFHGLSQHSENLLTQAIMKRQRDMLS